MFCDHFLGCYYLCIIIEGAGVVGISGGYGGVVGGGVKGLLEEKGGEGMLEEGGVVGGRGCANPLEEGGVYPRRMSAAVAAA